MGLSEHLQSMPTFFDHFSGVKINWTAATDIDHFAFSEDAWWYNLKQLEFLHHIRSELRRCASTRY